MSRSTLQEDASKGDDLVIVKSDLGQFYTTKAKYILNGLENDIPKGSEIIDPFAGNYDLLNLYKDRGKVVGYDIDSPNKMVIKRDTLRNPIDYVGKWVITNPPYLQKNKSKDKTIFNKYNTDDLYKCAIKSIIGCEGGILIVPLNFFSSSDNTIRKIFMNQYKILKVNVFEEKVFDDTDYTVCSFSFIKQENSGQKIPFIFYPSQEIIELEFSKQNKYSLDYIIMSLPIINIGIGRLIEGQNKYISSLFLRAIDTGDKDGMISLSLREPYYGKKTDRTFATIVFDDIIQPVEEKLIVEKFNDKLLRLRTKYRSMFLSSYRNSTSIGSRKRISFTMAYHLILHCLYEIRK